MRGKGGTQRPRIADLALCGALAWAAGAGTARAGTLVLSCQLLAGGSSGSCATAIMYEVPGQYNYVQSFSSPAGSISIIGSNIYAGPAYGSLGSAGFIDDYAFQISPAQADVVTATINLAGEFSVSNLFARIYSLTATQAAWC